MKANKMMAVNVSVYIHELIYTYQLGSKGEVELPFLNQIESITPPNFTRLVAIVSPLFFHRNSFSKPFFCESHKSSSLSKTYPQRKADLIFSPTSCECYYLIPSKRITPLCPKWQASTKKEFIVVVSKVEAMVTIVEQQKNPQPKHFFR